jgi:CheY-like chemotaxis protein
MEGSVPVGSDGRMEFVPMRFANIEEARQVVSAIRSLVRCPLGAAFREGPYEAMIVSGLDAREPLLFFSRGACTASRLAGIRLPRGGQALLLDPGAYTRLLSGSESPDDAATPTSRDAGPLRVMIVEDHRDTAVLLASMLETWGFRTAVAFTGEEALQLATEFRPRVVLLDLGLPDRHGYWVAQQMRDRPHDPAMSFVAVTGWSHGAEHVSPAAGISHHLVKPVDPDALRSILRRFASPEDAPQPA